MSGLGDFLRHSVEGYLLEDIETMKAAQLPPGKRMGAVGYPLVMTVFSGIELLGALLSPETFKKGEGEVYFCHYWKNYLYTSEPRSRAGGTLYQLVRHGLAHAFVTKGDFTVSKGLPLYHLTHDSGSVNIDAVELANDFRRSYFDRFRVLASASTGNVNASTVELRLREILQTFAGQATARGVLAKLPGPPAAPSGQVLRIVDLAQGVSGSAAPFPSKK